MQKKKRMKGREKVITFELLRKTRKRGRGEERRKRKNSSDREK